MFLQTTRKGGVVASKYKPIHFSLLRLCGISMFIGLNLVFFIAFPVNASPKVSERVLFLENGRPEESFRLADAIASQLNDLGVSFYVLRLSAEDIASVPLGMRAEDYIHQGSGVVIWLDPVVSGQIYFMTSGDAGAELFRRRFEVSVSDEILVEYLAQICRATVQVFFDLRNTGDTWWEYTTFSRSYIGEAAGPPNTDVSLSSKTSKNEIIRIDVRVRQQRPIIANSLPFLEVASAWAFTSFSSETPMLNGIRIALSGRINEKWRLFIAYDPYQQPITGEYIYGQLGYKIRPHLFSLGTEVMWRLLSSPVYVGPILAAKLSYDTYVYDIRPAVFNISIRSVSPESWALHLFQTLGVAFRLTLHRRIHAYVSLATDILLGDKTYIRWRSVYSAGRLKRWRAVPSATVGFSIGLV